jgi:translation initiation factor IF-3
MVGIVSIDEALKRAEEAEIDLVEVSPTAQPPVVRIMDYGKYLYQESKKHEHQHHAKVKEVKFKPNIGDADYKVKVKNIVKFLGEGDRVKVTMQFKGRQMAHQDLGKVVLEKIIADVPAVVEQHPRFEGRQIGMMLAPVKK